MASALSSSSQLFQFNPTTSVRNSKIENWEVFSPFPSLFKDSDCPQSTDLLHPISKSDTKCYSPGIPIISKVGLTIKSPKCLSQIIMC